MMWPMRAALCKRHSFETDVRQPGRGEDTTGPSASRWAVGRQQERRRQARPRVMAAPLGACFTETDANKRGRK